MGHFLLEGKADDTKEAGYQETFGYLPLYNIRGEAATTTLNLEP